jgi:ethanolamine utilization protein EutQ (cupin superfamily)
MMFAESSAQQIKRMVLSNLSEGVTCKEAGCLLKEAGLLKKKSSKRMLWETLSFK